MNNKGFTLIELLVVVLIIGILSAIALPQYETAVEKSRMSEALINLKAITDSSQRYFQANPNDSVITNKNQIADVDLRGGSWSSNGRTYSTDLFVYALGTNAGGVSSAYRTDTPDSYLTSYIYRLWQKPDSGDGSSTKGCDVGPDDPETGEQMCKFFTGI